MIWETLWNTPWWVYVLFFYLMSVGIKASNDRVVSLKKLFILPIILTVMSLHTLFTAVKINTLIMTIFFISLVLSAVIGYWQVARLPIKVDKKNWLIHLPGTWSTLIIILVIFGSKYYFGYELAIDPHLVEQTPFELSLLTVSGFCTGYFIGRLVAYVLLFRRAH